MKILSILITLFISTTVIAESSKVEREEANELLLTCLYRNSLKIDDGVTSVNTIARVVASNCSREEFNYVDVLIRDIYPIDRARIHAAVAEKNINSAAYFILNNRTAKK
jgi:hypothetical protein